MKQRFKRHLARWMALLLLLSLTACGQPSETGDSALQVACTTYPVYLLAQEVTADVPGVAVTLVIDQQVSCLHNYTLTMQDMKTIEAADVLAINGAGMEHFLEDVLEGRRVIDCSAGLDLLWNEEEGEEDAHLWLDPERYGEMAGRLAEGLRELDPDHGGQYTQNAAAMQEALSDFHQAQLARLESLTCRALIPFHNGFQYFAQAFDLTIVASVEEEEGSEASAKRIQELVQLVDAEGIPALFTETNGPDSAARALAQERNLPIFPLNMGMSREAVPEELTGLAAYEWVLTYDIDTLLEAYS